MFVETLKASIAVKTLAVAVIGVIAALFIKKAMEEDAPGDNFPHAVMYR